MLGFASESYFLLPCHTHGRKSNKESRDLLKPTERERQEKGEERAYHKRKQKPTERDCHTNRERGI
uniref:Uncharacterized protein n=1 Tax=Rhizophora mucronata TaxID=61149 RepID=A0A2P2M9B9_RHIMU